MLVLIRKKGQSIAIGDSTVKVAEVTKTGKVRLEIEAPRDVKILRTEILEGAKSGSLSGLDAAELFTGQPKGIRGEERSEQSV